MATRYLCDRCDFSTENRDDILSVAIPQYNQYAHDLRDCINKTVDLCSRCIRQLNEFVKPLPKEN